MERRNRSAGSPTGVSGISPDTPLGGPVGGPVGVPAGLPADVPVGVSHDVPPEAAPRILRFDTLTSTQDEAARRLADGQLPPFAVTARRQTSGRGRLGREFASPDGASVSFTYVHRTALAPHQRGWFPLAAGLAAVLAVAEVLGTRDGRSGSTGPTGPTVPEVGLKWPNDLHVEDGRKLGGILVEGRGTDALLLGIGLNLRGPVRREDGTAVPGAAWLLGEQGIRSERWTAEDSLLRERLEDALATALTTELAQLESTGGDGVSAGTHGRYTMTCLTLGRAVRVDPLGETGAGGATLAPLRGIARMIDEHGRLILDLAGGRRTAVDVGDVRHLRPDDQIRSTTGDAMGVEQEEHCA